MGCRFCYSVLSTLFLASCGLSSLDITELSSFQYSIDISSQPVILDQATEKEGILLSSKHGQKYQCQYESFSQFSQKVREEEENASKQSVTGLLQTMEGNPCLILTTGWWTYEFCYKKHIKQFHMSEQKVTGDVLYLGFYAKEFDWGVKSEKEVSEVRHRYHSQQYVNGSLCDLTGTTRSAEVRFKCKEDSLDTLVSVEEPSTCKYLLHVSTPHLCKHPSLRQVPEKTSLPIVCNPVLSDSDYKDYVEYQKRLTEQRDKEEDTQLERKKGPVKSGDGSSDLDGTSDDVDLEGDGFGFIEIGNTRVKFYVLNYDAMAQEDKKLSAESDSAEGTTHKKELSPPSDSSSSSSSAESPSILESSSSSSEPPSILESSSEPSSILESSSSSSELSKVKSLESEVLELDSDKDRATSEEMFGKDSKEFLKIYKRLLSNKKLRSFVKQSRPPKDETLEVRARVEVSETSLEDGDEEPAKEDEDLSIEDEGLIIQDAQSADADAETAKKQPSPAAKKEDITDEEYDKEMLRVYLEGLFASAGGKELASSAEETEDVVEREIADKQPAGSSDGVEKPSQGGTMEMAAHGKGEEVPATTEGSTKSESDQNIVGQLFKKENTLSEEHKNIHNMIMAIIKQSDRGAKEVSRHADMKKNYEFDWEKQKKLAKILKKSKKRDEL